MAQTTDNRAIIAFKKLLSKAHTDDAKALGNEALAGYVSTNYSEVVAKSINSTPATAVSDGTVELVTAAVFVEDVTSNSHAFTLTYPVGWAGSRGSPGDRITGAVPPAFGTDYEIDITLDGGGTLAVLDSRNWVYDYENGVFWQQTAGASPDPDTADVYIFHADTFLDQVMDTKADTITVREEDGTPSVSPVTEIRVSNGTLTDNGSGSVSISTGGGGGGTPTDITVADESTDTTCFPAFFTAATGDLEPKTDSSGLTYNSSTETLSATNLSGANTNWDAAFTHVSSNGSDHTYIDQDVTSGSAPTFTADNLSDGGGNAIVTTTQETNWDTHLTSNGSDHTFIDQDVTSGSSPTFDGTNITGVASVDVADESADTTCFPLFSTAATGAIAPKTGSNLTFNSSTGELTATTLTGANVTSGNDPGHTHSTAAITSGTFADARIAESNVTQHQAALSITESQISDLDHNALKIQGVDVTVSGLADGQILVYDAASGDWENKDMSPEYEVQVDDAGSGVTYVGEATPGSATSSAVYRIKRITETGNDVVIEYADGNANFDNIWDNRASLSYS